MDASVALKWFVVEADSDVAERLLGQAETLHAPELLKTEVANGLWSNISRRLITTEQATVALSRIARSITRWHSVDAVLPQALAWAVRYDHPIHDLCYLALARSLGERLITADQKLLRRLAGSEEAKHLMALSELR